MRASHGIWRSVFPEPMSVTERCPVVLHFGATQNFWNAAPPIHIIVLSKRTGIFFPSQRCAWKCFEACHGTLQLPARLCASSKCIWKEFLLRYQYELVCSLDPVFPFLLVHGLKSQLMFARLAMINISVDVHFQCCFCNLLFFRSNLVERIQSFCNTISVINYFLCKTTQCPPGRICQFKILFTEVMRQARVTCYWKLNSESPR